MSVYSQLFGGPTTVSKPSDPTLEGWQSSMFNNADPGLSLVGHQAKSLLKRIGAGGDVSDLGELTGIAQRHAVNQRSIGDEYAYGGNALIANNAPGSEQANILQRMKSGELSKDREQEGLEYTQGLTNLRQQAADQLEQDRQSRMQMTFANQQAAMNNRLGYYGNRYQVVNQQGLFPTLAGMAAQAGTAAAGF